MLTEDIDSTLRVLAAGAKIASDPALISRELAPDHRRRAVEAAHPLGAGLVPGLPQAPVAHLALPAPDPAPEGGLAFLLGWREVYPWLSLQILPVLGLHRLPRRRRRAPATGRCRHCCCPRCSRSPSARRRRCSPGAWRCPRSAEHCRLVLELPAGVLDRLHGVEEHHRPRSPRSRSSSGRPSGTSPPAPPTTPRPQEVSA